MRQTKYAIGLDISTQTTTAMLIGVVEERGLPSELVISSDWMARRPYGDETERKDPSAWIRQVRECLRELAKSAGESASAEAIGVSTTFPGVFPIFSDGRIDPACVSLYDDTDDAGICGGQFEGDLALAESDTLSRMWPGNMAIGLASLVRSCGLGLEEAAAIVPPNSAFVHGLLRESRVPADPRDLESDFTQTIIGGLYDYRTAEPVPEGVCALMKEALPEIEVGHLRKLLPRAAPSWRNAVPSSALAAVRGLLGLPGLRAVSVGAGDSPLGALALLAGRDAILNVRGSSDSPMIIVDSPRERASPRETVLHYPLPTVTGPADSPWCVVAPMLRTGKVWDWVRRLRFADGDSTADAELERLAAEALRRRLISGSAALTFDTALGGERALDWDSSATGTLKGLLESHTIGDIALAALEGMSARLAGCLTLMEERSGAKRANLLLAGGPTSNRLWNWITRVYTGRETFVTRFSDASLLGAAMLGYAAAYDGIESDAAVSTRLGAVSELASRHPLIAPTPVTSPDPDFESSEAIPRPWQG